MEQTTKTASNQLGVVHMNLVHLLFIHGMLANFYNQPETTGQLESFVHDLCLIHEYYIDNIDDDSLKEKMHYKPIKTKDNEKKTQKS